MKKYLSRSEKCILRLIDEGCSSKQIAERFFNSVRTIETHRHKIIKKLRVHNCQEAIIKARKKGWL